MRRAHVDGSTVTGVNSGERGTRLGSIASFAGDGVLALAIAVAGGASAAGATSSESGKVLLVLLAFVAALSLAVRRVYPLSVFAIVVVVTAFFGWVYGGYWPFAALLAFYSLAAHSPRKRALVAGVAGFAFLALSIAHDIEWQPVTWSKIALFAGRMARRSLPRGCSATTCARDASTCVRSRIALRSSSASSRRTRAGPRQRSRQGSRARYTTSSHTTSA